MVLAALLSEFIPAQMKWKKKTGSQHMQGICISSFLAAVTKRQELNTLFLKRVLFSSQFWKKSQLGLASDEGLMTDGIQVQSGS